MVASNSALKKEEIRGIIPPLVSTFTLGGDLALDLFINELKFMSSVGISLAVVGGSTGSGDELSPDELATLIGVATSQSSLRIIAGVITTTTRDAIRRGLLAKEAGACALMLGPPIYTTPSAEGLDNFITDVASATGLPIIYYNHFFNPPSVMKRIADLPGVICLKEVALEPVSELVQTVGDKVAVAAGADCVNIASFLFGAHASISGINTVIPHQYREIFAAHERRDYLQGRMLTEKIAPLAREMIKPDNFPARVKYAINLLGRSVGEPRKPSGNLAPDDRRNIEAAIRHAGLLK
ncbi:dihydrodipicolinate synthase [Caballeronia udeis]|uniref:Dihydrodipicolinate synthase n=1 Tax=Caballeronia udeis TaxID=1232866 RepID=A0A158IAP9_9BURK|nr:dihydrodipicolinate synthase family protein [Caballeronia udeis]SAL53634.1 dihydrodipicolinate synthase [Caballeronia udeis]